MERGSLHLTMSIKSVIGSIKTGRIKSSSGIATSLKTAGPGLRATVLPGGRTMLTADIPRRTKRTINPFTLYDASTTSGGVATLKIGITPGLVNSISPSTAGGTLAATPPPLATITATTHFWLKCVGTFGEPDTHVVTVETSASATPPAANSLNATGFTTCLYLGYAIVSGGAIASIYSASNPTWSSLICDSSGSAVFWSTI
jgi:hypothetical protein